MYQNSQMRFVSKGTTFPFDNNASEYYFFLIRAILS